jgi:hypothetical protein
MIKEEICIYNFSEGDQKSASKGKEVISEKKKGTRNLKKHAFKSQKYSKEVFHALFNIILFF